MANVKEFLYICNEKNSVRHCAYTYDHSNRISSVSHKLNNGSTVTLASYTYDNVGRMATKKLHGSSTNQLTYTYNVRSWLTGINSGKFTQNLYYNTGSGTPYYNGNISSMTWKSGNETTIRGYKYSYDAMNRLTAGNYGEGSTLTSNTGRYSEIVGQYDKNGNISAGFVRNGLLSTGGYGTMNALVMTLDGNHLKAVRNATGGTAAPGSFGFVDGVTQTTEYTYDNNGNLTQDLNKGISNISYNSLNLPQVVTFSNGNTITYLYTADGRKLRTIHVTNGTATTTDYCGNVIYENGTQKLLLTEEGYINLANGNAYYYYLKDHQGNNRVVVSSSGTVMETNHYYPFGGVFSTSTNVQPYKYNGKELDTKNGLNWYDYGARHYDAALGRWHVVDPLGEKMYGWNPYGYCFNNPVKFVDPTGALVSPYFDYEGNFLGVDEQGFAGQIKITTPIQFASMKSTGDYNTGAAFDLQETVLSANAMSNIYTKVLTEKGYDVNLLEGNAISVIGDLGDTFNNPSSNVRYASTKGSSAKDTFTISVNNSERAVRKELNTVENIQSALGDHEFVGHGVNKQGDYNKTHSKVYEYQMSQPVYGNTTEEFKKHMEQNARIYTGK